MRDPFEEEEVWAVHHCRPDARADAFARKGLWSSVEKWKVTVRPSVKAATVLTKRQVEELIQMRGAFVVQSRGKFARRPECKFVTSIQRKFATKQVCLLYTKHEIVLVPKWP